MGTATPPEYSAAWAVRPVPRQWTLVGGVAPPSCTPPGAIMTAAGGNKAARTASERPSDYWDARLFAPTAGATATSTESQGMCLASINCPEACRGPDVMSVGRRRGSTRRGGRPQGGAVGPLRRARSRATPAYTSLVGPPSPF